MHAVGTESLARANNVNLASLSRVQLVRALREKKSSQMIE